MDSKCGKNKAKFGLINQPLALYDILYVSINIITTAISNSLIKHNNYVIEKGVIYRVHTVCWIHWLSSNLSLLAALVPSSVDSRYGRFQYFLV